MKQLLSDILYHLHVVEADIFYAVQVCVYIIEFSIHPTVQSSAVEQSARPYKKYTYTREKTVGVVWRRVFFIAADRDKGHTEGTEMCC